MQLRNEEKTENKKNTEKPKQQHERTSNRFRKFRNFLSEVAKRHETEMIKIEKYFALQETVGRQTSTWNERKRSNEKKTPTARI